jgi:hypothetical protein
MRLYYSILFFLLLLLPLSLWGQKKDSITLSRPKVTTTVDSIQNITNLKDTLQAQKGFLKKMSSPKKAMLLSLCLPGAGQIYNKKGVWWKLPFCYSIYAGTIVTHVRLRRDYFFFKELYEYRVINDPKPAAQKAPFPTKIAGRVVNPLYQQVELKNIFNQKDKTRDPYERSYIWLGAAHLYAVADAFVTAHLNAFDISDDLSLRIRPKYDFTTQKPMLGIAFQLK